MEWSAKIGPEAQTEVVISRILWGLGYHQPPIYYLPSWTLERRRHETHTRERGAFPAEAAALRAPRTRYWHWEQNPFVGTRELSGLLVVLLMLNSTDLKDDNNALYKLKEPWDGAMRWFVVRDLGAALGETGKLYPRRNWLEGFEQARVHHELDGDRRRSSTTRDATRSCMSMIHAGRRALGRRAHGSGSPTQQWRDAFRAANYADADAERFIRAHQRKD